LRLHRIQQFGASQEDDTGAGQRQHHAAIAGIEIKIMPAALHRAKGDGIDDQPRFGARLDHEKASDLLKHRHSLTPQRIDDGFEPFPS
jgi:hypothetical protein